MIPVENRNKYGAWYRFFFWLLMLLLPICGCKAVKLREIKRNFKIAKHGRLFSNFS